MAGEGVDGTLDRAAGVLLGAAVGDALGVPAKHGSRALTDATEMLGVGDHAPGQWSDGIATMCAIARVAATGADLRSSEALDAIADGFLERFATGPPDVDTRTRAVLTGLRPGPGSAARMRGRAAELHRAGRGPGAARAAERTGRNAGNASLMRTAPVALAHLGDPDAIVEAAHAVSALTHHDPVAGEACALWCLTVDHAVRTGTQDLRVGLDRLDPQWTTYVEESEYLPPSSYARNNGWVVTALFGAWAAVEPASSFSDGVVAAVRGGGETGTVATIAGALLGAGFGASAVPDPWRRDVHGWPGLRGSDLSRLALDCAGKGAGGSAEPG